MPSIPLGSKSFDKWEPVVPWHSTRYWTLWSLSRCVLIEWNQLTACDLHKALAEVYWLHFSILWNLYLLRKDPCSNQVNLIFFVSAPSSKHSGAGLTGQKFVVGSLMPSWLRNGCFPLSIKWMVGGSTYASSNSPGNPWLSGGAAKQTW